MPELEGAEARRALRKPEASLTSWELAMRASWLIRSGGANGFAEAERLAAAAAVLRPDWGLPFSLIAVARFQQAMRSFSAADSRTAFAGTLEAARRALDIDDRAWIAHALCGVGELWTNRNHERAQRHVDRAIALNPSASMNYHFGGCVAGFSGDLGTALQHQERLLRMDSVYPYTAVIEADLGLWHMLAADHDAAEERLLRAHRWDPCYGRALQRMVSLYGLRGKRDHAREAARKLSDLGLPLDLKSIAASYPFRRTEHYEVFVEGLKRSGVED
jgi:tetratricopeptide (TPR) repeat protein